MRVLHITNAYPTPSYGAYGIFIKEQIQSLEEKGVKNEVCFINTREKGVNQYILAAPRIRSMVKDCDLVHCHLSYSGMAYLLATGNSKPMVFSSVDDVKNQPRKIDRLFFNILSRVAKAIIFKNDLRIDDKESRFHYLPNGVNTELFQPMDKAIARKKLGLDEQRKYILFVAAAGIKRKEKRYDKYCAVIKHLSEKGNICFPLIMTNIERSQTPYYYNACDALLVTSDYEGSPNMVKEAMACNLPVVSVDVGNVRLMLSHCCASFVSNSGSIVELAELLEKSLKIKERNEREQIFSKQLDMERVADKLVFLYEKVLNTSA